MKRIVVIAATVVTIAAAVYTWQKVGASGPALPLRMLGDYTLTGSTSRFDYASMDQSRGILWLAHMGDGAVEAFDVRSNRVVLTVPLSPDAAVRGILAVDARVYAAAQGLRSVVVIDAVNGKRIATIAAGDVDGLAYDPTTRRVFVSDETGGREMVIDARTNRAIGAIALGGEAGNTVYDAASHHIFVGVQTKNAIAEIDPATLKILRRYPLAGCNSSHSLVIDAMSRAVFVGCQYNVRLIRLDLRNGAVTSLGSVGIGVDVLALDPGMHRLYVASESGIVSAYDIGTVVPRRVAQAFLALNAHVVAVDIATHRVYFPLQNLGGKPVLRVMQPQ